MDALPADIMELIDQIEAAHAAMTAEPGSIDAAQVYTAAAFHGAPRLIQAIRDLTDGQKA